MIELLISASVLMIPTAMLIALVKYIGSRQDNMETNYLFIENHVSGFPAEGLAQSFGASYRGLTIIIDDGMLIIRPEFPGNLLPEAVNARWHRNIPVLDVAGVKEKGSWVVLSYGGGLKYSLQLKRKDEFIHVLLLAKEVALEEGTDLI